MDVSATTCPACGAPVTEDRLTCQECGTVIASVTGAATHPQPPPAATPGLFDDAALAAATPPAPLRAAGPEPALPPPTAPPVHTADIVAAPHPAARAELPPNAWYSARAGVAPPPGATAPAPPASAARAGLLSDLPMQVPATLGGRLAVAGLAFATFAFLLPWSPLFSGIGWFDAWGLARVSRLLVFLAALALLVLAVEPFRLSARVRTGWLPALFGTFAIGLFWERTDVIAVVGLGAWLFVIGGIVAAVGGLLVLNQRAPEPPAA